MTWYWQPAERALGPRVDDIERERRVHADRRVQRRGRLPRAVAHAGDVLADASRRLQRQRAAVAGHDVALADETRREHLQPLERRIDVAGRSPGRAFLAQHVPGLERAAQREMDAAHRDFAHRREAELEMRREPLGLERVAGLRHLGEHVLEILPDEPRQQEAVVQLGAPALRALRRRAAARSGRSARAAAAAGRGSCAHAAASRMRAARGARGARRPCPGSTACRYRTRCGACCPSRRRADCGRGDR